MPPPAGRHADPFSMVGILLSTSLLGWYRAGEDVQSKIPSLSTYLGHREPASTYWYYSDSRVIPILAPLRVWRACGLG